MDTALQQNGPNDAGAQGTPERPRLIALTRDPALMEALDYAESDGRLAFAADEARLASLLMGGDAGIVVFDAGACSSPVAELAERLHAQLPDVVLVAAGRASDQSELAAQVAAGTVYRFLHKPVSNQRVKLFVDAAWRRFKDGTTGTHTALPEEAEPSRHAPLIPVLAGIAVVVVVAVGTWLALRPSHSVPATQEAGARSSPSKVMTGPNAAAAGPGAAANPPPAVNSAPQTAAAPASTAADTRIDQLATQAEQALLAGNLAEAVRLTNAARSIDPASGRIKLLQAQIQHEQEQRAAQAALAAQAAQSQQAALAARADAEHARQQAAAQALTAQQVQARQAQAPPPGQAAPAQQAQAQAQEAAAPQKLPATNTQTGSSTQATQAGTAIASAGERPAAAPLERRGGPAPAASKGPLLGYDNGESGLHDPEKIVPESVLERLSTVEPEYPAAAQSAAGVVDLEFTVRPDGSVGDVTVTHAEPAGVFDDAAVTAVRQWRYRPVEREGLAVNQRARLRLSFSPQ